MHRHLRSCAIFILVLGLAVHVQLANEPPVVLPEFSVEGTPWLYAKLGNIEILSRASLEHTRRMAASLVRGMRLCPDSFTQTRPLPLQLIIVEDPGRTVHGLKPAVFVEANPRHWPAGQMTARESSISLSDEWTGVVAINLGNIDVTWMIVTDWAKQSILAQRPAFAEWVCTGLFGEAGPLYDVVGFPHTTTVRFPRLSWPDDAVSPGEFPADAGGLPDFATMFDPARKTDGMSPAEKRKFQFQTALFARWSLFGPVTSGRNRNGYWAFAEMARRGQATEEVFRQCYGMDWPQACVEMRAYLKPKNLGMLELRMPHVMADVPEVERLGFRAAAVEEAWRLLGEFNRLQAAEEAERNKSEKGTATKPKT